MSGVKVGPGVYTYKKDRDDRGVYYWLVSPSGELLAYLPDIETTRRVLAHLNRTS